MNNANSKIVNRRKFLSVFSKSLLALCAGSVALTGSGILSAFNCRVTRCEVVLSGLHPVFDGFLIALLADFHHGPWVPSSYIASTVRRVNNLKADLVVLAGDYVDNGGEWANGCIHELAALQSSYGTVAVLGNHDNYNGAAPLVRKALSLAGISDLTNCGVTLLRNGKPLRVGGVGDYETESQKIEEALGNVCATKSSVLLAHNPDYAETISDERVGLVLSGHTHGGQVVVPFINASFASTAYGKKYLSGLCQAPVTQVFVTRGIGTTTLPIRLNCPPEISLITLRTACRPI